jgi:hypothetical protein
LHHSYDEIAKAVLDVLIAHSHLSSLDVAIPDVLIKSFGYQCEQYGLLDNEGKFIDAHRLVDLFCGKLKIK